MINLYYDTIVEGIPAPNGSRDIELTKDAQRIPCIKKSNKVHPVFDINTFYFLVRAQKAVVNLYTGKQRASNLFYPLEIHSNFFNWNREWTPLIANRARKMIQKNKMKLLLIAPGINLNDYYIDRFKERIDDLVEKTRIPKNQIYVILGDINNSYSDLLDCKVFGIDYHQIYTQMLLKCRWGISDASWIFRHDMRAKTLHPSLIKKEYRNVNEWNPDDYFDIIPSNKSHDINLLIEMIYKDLTPKVSIDIDVTNYSIGNPSDYINSRKSIIEKNKKVDIIQNLDRFKFSNLGSNSLCSIVCDNIHLIAGSKYKNSLTRLSPGFNIYRMLAQGHPFMVLGSLNTMHYLNNEGYFSYNELLNQSYDNNVSVLKRVEEIGNNIEKILSMDKNKLSNIIKDMKPFLAKNQKKFLTKRLENKLLDLFIDIRYE